MVSKIEERRPSALSTTATAPEGDLDEVLEDFALAEHQTEVAGGVRKASDDSSNSGQDVPLRKASKESVQSTNSIRDRIASGDLANNGMVLDVDEVLTPLTIEPFSPVPEILAPMTGVRQGDLVIHPRGNLELLYECQNEIGRGGYGVVRKAKSKDTKELCAIKSISLSYLKDTETGAFDKELVFAFKVDHPYVVRLIDSFCDDESLHLVMELCTGCSMHDLVRGRRIYGQPRGFPGPKLGRYIWEMLSGIAYLHHHRIVHRDCKPANYMQQRESETSPLKLIDFGLAVRKHRRRPLTAKVGTPDFAAPEVSTGSYNEKCDIWSIGVCSYICCVGIQPFNGETIAQVMERVQNTMPSYNPALWSLVDPRFKGIVQEMLVKDPSVRQSAKKLADQNESWLTKIKETEAKIAAKLEQNNACTNNCSIS